MPTTSTVRLHFPESEDLLGFTGKRKIEMKGNRREEELLRWGHLYWEVGDGAIKGHELQRK